jgi:hypothetical protein
VWAVDWENELGRPGILQSRPFYLQKRVKEDLA